MTTPGERLKAEREAKKRSQQQVAEAAGVSKAAISALETGKNKNPQPETLFRAAEYLGLNPRWLGVGEGPKYAVAEDHGDYNATPLDILLDAARRAYARGSLTTTSATAIAQLLDTIGSEQSEA